MKLIEKTIAFFSPGWAAERAKGRHILNMYEAAKPTRTHKAQRESSGANVSVAHSAVSLREQAR